MLPFPRRAAQSAPLRRQWHDAQLRDDAPCGQPQNRSEGRVGDLQLGQLLDPHAGGHARGDNVDDLQRLLTHHVRSQHAMRLAVHDQLAEALGAAIDHRPIHVGIGHHGHDNIAIPARLLLGQADAGILGMGKATVGHDRVFVAIRSAQQRVFDNDARLVAGALHQHHAPIDVAGRVDVRRTCLPSLVAYHVAAIGFDARCGQVQPAQVAQPAGGHHDRFCLQCCEFVALFEDQRQVAAGALDAFDAADAGAQIDAATLERGSHRLRDKAVFHGQNARRDIQHGDLRAKGVEDRGELTAGRGPTDDGH